MSTNDKQEILRMLETGKIDAQTAANMLSELAQEKPIESTEDSTPNAVSEASAAKPDDTQPSMFRVRVRNLDTGENKVSVNIPVGVLKLGLKMGARFSPELKGFSFEEINEMMTDMQTGMLVEVQDEESNEHVQVYIE